MAENYKYYPHGDRDFTGPQRHDNKVLKREGSTWFNLGSRENPYNAEDLLEIRRNVISGRGKIQKINEAGQIVEGGRADLLKWTKDLEKGGLR